MIESQGLVIAKLQHQLDILLKQIMVVNLKVYSWYYKPADFIFTSTTDRARSTKETPREKEIVATYQHNKNHKGRRLTEGCEHLPIREKLLR